MSRRGKRCGAKRVHRPGINSGGGARRWRTDRAIRRQMRNAKLPGHTSVKKWRGESGKKRGED